ncbi:PepSY domain-containing protein [Ideonella sp. YS5]|uniref:PepSY domain-containing protein n=1 Tax=Ideonella sp. YS5 TaxID=3453714 RepID=UPI003EE957D7
MKHPILAAALSLAAAALPITASAKADCTAHPKAEWMSEADAKAKIVAQGYTINKFKVDGHCYEIYGKNKDGKKVEIYFDTKTLDVVKSEIEK